MDEVPTAFTTGEEVMEKRTVKKLRTCFEDKHPLNTHGSTPPRVQDLNYEHLVVYGLERSVNDADLREYFEEFGKVAVAKVREDMSTDSVQVQGFVIIRYSDHEVQRKVQSMKHTIKNHEVDVTFQMYDKRYKHLIVHSLASSISGADLKKYFEKFGEVVLSEVREDLKAAKSQGFVIMCLASFDEMWGKKHVIEGHELVVEFQGPLNILTVEITASKHADANTIQKAVATAIAKDPSISQNWCVIVAVTGEVAPSSMAIVQMFSSDVDLDPTVVKVALASVRSCLKPTLLLTKKYTGHVHPFVVIVANNTI